MDRLTKILLAAAVMLLFVRPALAAPSPTVKLVGPVGLIRAGDTVSINVRADSGGRTINVVDIHLVYNPLFLQVLRVDQQQSLWPLWPEQPHWDNQTGTLSLVAGRPHGVVAVDATVATVIFKASASGLAGVGIDAQKTGVYVNDGQGTRLAATGTSLELGLADTLVQSIPLRSTTSPSPDAWTATDSVHVRWEAVTGTSYSYTFSSNVSDVPDDTAEVTSGQVDYLSLDDGVHFFTIKNQGADGTWSVLSQYRFLLDRQAPEPFTLVLPPANRTRDRQVVSWLVVDATSGVAQTRLMINQKDLGAVTSPLIVQPSWAGKTLTIVAIDGAGNKQQASWRVPGVSTFTTYVWALVVILVIVIIVVLSVHRRKR